MPALADAGDRADGPMSLRHQPIHQRRLADTGVAEQHGDAAVQQFLEAGEWFLTAGGDDGEVEVGELRGERCRRCQVGLGQTQDRVQAAGVGGDQCPVDQAGARGRIGQRHHHHHLVGVGHHHALGRVGVIGGAAQHRAARPPSDDPRQAIGATGGVADDVHPVADDDRGAAQFPGPHRGHQAIRVAVEHATPPAAVHGDHHGRLGVGVFGTGLSARTRSTAGPHMHVGLVVLPSAQRSPSLSMLVHSRGKSGSVLAVVAMSSTATPGVRSPMMAPAVAIR